jgi:16S rRNA (guanine(966)-N(2))-methyltransferase RsmD
MDNQKKEDEASKTYKKVNYYDKNRRTPYQGQNRFNPRQDRFTPRERNEKFQGRNNDKGFQNREVKDRFNPKFDKFQPRGTKFPPKSGQFPPRRNFRPTEKPFDKRFVKKPPVYSEMQITDGKHRGKFLESISSSKVRPTVRRMREIMFKIIFRRIRAGRVLDLCAGSGMVGIESISRGAIVCTFVDRSSRMCGIIKKNLESCGIKEGHGEIIEMEAMPYLKKIAKRKRKWDVVFYDPPYDANYDEVLELLSRGVALEKNGSLVIEHHSEMFFPEKLGVLSRFKVVLNGENAMSFYERLV